MPLFQDGAARSCDLTPFERTAAGADGKERFFFQAIPCHSSSSLVLRCRDSCCHWLRAIFLLVFLISTAEAQNAPSWSASDFSESQPVGQQSGFFQSNNSNLNGMDPSGRTNQPNTNRDWPSVPAPDAMRSPIVGTSSGTMEKNQSWPGSPVTERTTNPHPSPTNSQLEKTSLSGNGSIPLRHANEKSDRLSSGAESARSFGSRTAPWMTTISALAIVLGTLFLFYWGMKRLGPRTNQLLPSEAVEMLGYTSLSGRQRLCLIRLGRKLVLVAVSSDTVEPLTEIDDPVEVDRLVGLCASQRNGSATQVFHQVFSQYVNHPTSTG